ncbi:MAG TPA: hypothetical protein VGF59_20600 [Bryobacteraceae bacterium]|jgi:hypothetical protein
MRPLLFLALVAAAAAASPVDGTWEAVHEGKRAVSLTIHENSGKLEGRVVFYILKRNDGRSTTDADKTETPMVDPEWDGKTLRFSVAVSDDASDRFEMSLTGKDAARLKRLAGAGGPETTIDLRRAP